MILGMGADVQLSPALASPPFLWIPDYLYSHYLWLLCIPCLWFCKQSWTNCFSRLDLFPLSLVLKERSSSWGISHLLLFLPTHSSSVLRKCELLNISSSQDIPKTYAMSFHMHNISLLLLYLFLFLKKKSFSHHSVHLWDFLLFLFGCDTFQL